MAGTVEARARAAVREDDTPIAPAETKAQFRPDIQGLRAIAILLVLVFHGGLSVVSGGYVGVDVFFVISGFLITGHLWNEIGATGRVRFGRFYARRARRILPASFVVLAATVVGVWWCVAPLQRSGQYEAIVWTAAYVPNLLFARWGTDYHADIAPSLVQHYWSLGVEEQFYLLWPLALVVGTFVARRSRGRLIALVGGVVALSLLGSALMTSTAPAFAFFGLPTRAWELGMGGLVALLLAAGRLRLGPRAGAGVGWVGIALIAYAAFGLTEHTPFPGVAALAPVGGAALLLIAGGAADIARWAPARMLGMRPMLFIGAISYSLYLVHWPIVVLPQFAIGYETRVPVWVTLGLSALAVPVAWLVYRFVETPFRFTPRIAGARPAWVFVCAAAASLAIAGASWALTQLSKSETLDAGETAPSAEIVVAPIGTPYVPSNLTPTIREARYDVTAVEEAPCHQDFGSVSIDGCAFGADNAAPTVALFGDSHAAQWGTPLEQLAGSGDIVLTSYTKSACPSADAVDPGALDCPGWRDAVIEKLQADPPDVILLANFATRYVGERDGATEWWAERLAAVIADLPAESAVVVIADTPFNPVREVPACLSQNLDTTAACALDREVTESLSAIGGSLGGADGVIDMTDYLCDAELCPAVVGDTLVYRDSNHMTATFSAMLAPALATALEEFTGGDARVEFAAEG
ncbi:acyltransferase family protein [Demequina mangrovi]|uniref:Peptidoglycan/LPS O-acetylase OafA/YrhL, contains acyltransferase and SGNH-hydrolase domains n=1 Tax=Demequina mangrovi TaxID=1043493 RepID=A0A1H6YIM7_9MICO|nr:acyltransferase family protein [Demequina mangrovi]SEJ39694.1 Peptidoglycan/LPS O-acetylase OafA/YrhL, contains acyltransferase and SGNH-hydrolase domains [Demequina mangrovi]